jgi:hypothetical protein
MIWVLIAVIAALAILASLSECHHRATRSR